MHSEYDYVCQKWIDVSEALPQTDHMIKGIYRQSWSIRPMSRLETGVCKFLTITSSELRDTCEGRCRELHLFPHSWLAWCKCHHFQHCLGSALQQRFSSDCGGHWEVAKAKPCRRTKGWFVSLRAVAIFNFEFNFSCPLPKGMLFWWHQITIFKFVSITWNEARNWSKFFCKKIACVLFRWLSWNLCFLWIIPTFLFVKPRRCIVGWVRICQLGQLQPPQGLVKETWKRNVNR